MVCFKKSETIGMSYCANLNGLICEEFIIMGFYVGFIDNLERANRVVRASSFQASCCLAAQSEIVSPSNLIITFFRSLCHWVVSVYS